MCCRCTVIMKSLTAFMNMNFITSSKKRDKKTEKSVCAEGGRWKAKGFEASN